MSKKILLYLMLVCIWSADGMCSVAWVPEGLPALPADGPALCQGAYLTPEQGKAILDAALARFADLQSWDAYARHVRLRIQQAAGLMPLPRRTALNPVIKARRAYNGYTVENVAFESVPGYFVAGNLYRPTRPGHSYPVVLCTHGHTNRITAQDDYNIHGRFAPDMQIRCAMLARLGAVALSIDMFGCGDSVAQAGQEAHRSPFAMTIQLWNAIRALDFLLSLDCADPNRVAVTGESGGGTQCFLLTALDERVRLSVPVVMVSAHFFGGCPCESGRPIHRSQDHFVNNAMIAALAAPRPMLVISDGKDWTSNTPYVEYPFIKRIYSYYMADGNVANVHLADEGHDYGPSKRAAMYRFLTERFELDTADGLVSTDGKFDESGVTVEKADLMRVFQDGYPLPSHAFRSASAVEDVLKGLQL